MAPAPCTPEAEIGKLYLGNVRKITDFGAFVEIFPGTDGLVHISELAPKRVKRVEEALREFKNSKENNLGMALPKGRLRFYSRDDDGSLQFTGENNIGEAFVLDYRLMYNKSQEKTPNQYTSAFVMEGTSRKRMAAIERKEPKEFFFCDPCVLSRPTLTGRIAASIMSNRKAAPKNHGKRSCQILAIRDSRSSRWSSAMPCR